jgi:hypothetical protein
MAFWLVLLDAELNSASNTDQWSEYQEEIPEPAARFTSFIHVFRFCDGCSKFVGQVRKFFLLAAFQATFQ